MAEADLERIAREFRAALMRQEAEAARAMVRGLEAVERRVEAQVRRHLETIARAAERGGQAGITARYELGRLAALREQVAGELDRYGRTAGGVVSALQGRAAEDARAFTERFLAEVGGDTFRLAGLRPEAVQAITANLAQGSPLAELFASFGTEAGERVAAGVTAGVALGHHPYKIARTIGADVRQTYRGRARMIARTEAQRVARAVSAEAYAQAGDVLQGWRWWASRDDRCCVACWAQHGTLSAVGSVMDGHPGCRCVMVPALRDELASGPDPLDGESLFAQLEPARQAAILGPARFAAYQAGEVRLVHLAERVSNPRWGSHVRRSSLERARERSRLGLRGAGPAEVPAGRAPRLVEAPPPPTPAPELPAWRAELEALRAQAPERWLAGGDDALTRTNARGDVVPTTEALRQEELVRRAGEVMERELEERVAPALARATARQAEAKARYDAARAEYMAADEAVSAAQRATSDAFEAAMRPGSGDAATRALEAAEEAKALALARLHQASREVNEASDALWAAPRADNVRADAWRELLAEVRDTGYGPHAPTWAKGSNKGARAAADDVADVYPTEWWRRSAANGLPIEIKESTARAFYKERHVTSDARLVAQLKVPKTNHRGYQREVTAHEFGHRFEETIPEVRALEWTFYARRVRGGDVDAPLPTARRYSSGRKDERVRDAPEPFYNEYAGKDYGNAPTSYFEVFTMGVQSLFDPAGGAFGKDPDHVRFTLGVLALL